MRLKVILLLLVLALTNSLCPFPRKIWMYWSGGEEGLDLISKMCYSKIKKYSQQSNFQPILLTESNLHQYISNIEHFRSIVARSKCNFLANYGDLIKLVILQQNGGIYIDIASLLVEDFSWFDRFEGETQYIVNKYGQARHEPHALILFNSGYGYREGFWVGEGWTSTRFRANYLPGYESGFIASIKNATIIRKWREKFMEYYISDYVDIMKDLHQEDIYLPNTGDSSYFRVFYSLAYVVIKKQRQIDAQLPVLYEGDRPNANVQYRAWSINCIEGPCQTYFSGQMNTWGNMTRRTIAEMAVNYRPMRYFGKIINTQRPKLLTILNEAAQMAQHKQTLHQSFKRRYWFDNCQQINFIVEGSLFHSLLKDQYHEQRPLKIVSIQQRDAWVSFCERMMKDKTKDTVEMFKWQDIALVLFIVVFFDFPWTWKRTQHQKRVKTPKTFLFLIQSLKSHWRFLIKIVVKISILYIYKQTNRLGSKYDFQNTKFQYFIVLALGSAGLIIESVDEWLIKITPSKNTSENYLDQASRQIQIFLKPFFYFGLAKMTLNFHTDRQQNKILYSIMLGLVSPLLLTIMDIARQNYFQLTQKTNKMANKFLDKILDGHVYRSSIIVYLALITFVPRLNYLIFSPDANYLLSYVDSFAASFILFTLLGMTLFICLNTQKSAIQVGKSHSTTNISHQNGIKQRSNQPIQSVSAQQFTRIRKNYTQPILKLVLMLFSLQFYLSIYFHRMNHNWIREALQSIFLILLCFEYYQVFSVRVNRHSISQSFAAANIFNGLTMLAVLILLIITPYQFYVHDYEMPSTDSSKLLEVMIRVLRPFLQNFYQSCLIYLVFALGKEFLRICLVSIKEKLFKKDQKQDD